MTEQAFPLITFYKGWETYQQYLVDRHACATYRCQPCLVVPRVDGRRSPDLAPIVHWDPGDEEEAPALASAKLVAGLEATWHMIADALARWTPADLGYIFPSPSSLSEEEKRIFGERTRQWMIWHVIEHEIHHGGDLSLALGNYELPGIYANA